MRRLVPLALLLAATPARAQWWPERQNPRDVQQPLPERPFLLVDAARRFLPSEPAQVRVQLRGGGALEVALYRLNEPNLLAATGPAARQGLVIERAPLGREAEELLLERRGPLPRRGARLTLVRQDRLTMPPPRQPRRVTRPQEGVVYDSNETEESEVATWGVRVGEWSEREHGLGRLRAGTYLVRVVAGAWVTTALLSVGDLVLLVRRGDAHDTVLVTGADGAPLPGVAVEARGPAGVVARATTDARGEARLAGSDLPALRVLARRGADVAWADVAHARLAPCDPRVYVATGRPFYRPGETVHVRGHVMGCDAAGRYVALPHEPVRLAPGDVTVTTDVQGDFVAAVTADGTLTAEVRGRRQERPLRIDDRRLPRRAVTVQLDRAWATPGEVVTVRVADDEGGWPTERDVELVSPAGRMLGRIGPRRPAIFQFAAPSTNAPAERLAVSASVLDGSFVTMAAAELWVGRSPVLLELHADRERAAPDDRLDVSLRAVTVLGGAAAGRVALTVYGTDGNRPQGAARWQGEVVADAAGRATLGVPLPGAGPWLLEAARDAARAQLVVWERARPPQLGARGELAVAPEALAAGAGAELAVRLRAPAAGRTWVTLEQGSVWASALAGGGGRVALRVPEEARGMATVVATHIARGQVHTATARVEIAPAVEVALAATADRTAYAPGERARVALTARRPEGTPAPGVVASVWLADAGYWDLGEDEYPLPAPYLRRPGRMASGGDSTRPQGYGAEEGRVLAGAAVYWNERRLPQTSWRHGWGGSGVVVRLDHRGTLATAMRELARRVGLAGARVCAGATRRIGPLALRVVDLPWDLAVLRVAKESETIPSVDGRTLVLACPDEGGYGAGGGGLGHGGGQAAGIGVGQASVRSVREQRLEGTLAFLGLVPLGPSGRAEVALDLPRLPGRWRIEALGIAADGGGGRAHATVLTRAPLVAWVALPGWLRPGDEAAGAVEIVAPALAGRTVALRLQARGAVTLLGSPPAAVTLDAAGQGAAALRVRAGAGATGEVVVAARAGGLADTVRAGVLVGSPAADQPLALRALVGPGGRDVPVPLPPLAAASALTVRLGGPPAESLADALESLREPRWNLAVMRVDRLAGLRVLREAAGGGAPLAAAIDRAIAGEEAALDDLQTSSGAVAWFSTLPDSALLTAEALIALGPRGREVRWEGAWDALRARARAGGAGGAAPWVALALGASRAAADRTLARAELGRARAVVGDDLTALETLLRATEAVGDPAAARDTAGRLERALQARLARPAPRVTCGGPAWFLCFARWGERAGVARAARALLSRRHPGAQDLARQAAAWLGQGPPADRSFVWGTDEADEAALIAALGARAPRGCPGPLAVVDGRALPLAAGSVTVGARTRALAIRVPACAGRAGLLRVDGVLHAAPPAAPAGTARLARRFVRAPDGWALELGLAPARSARDVEVRVPLPAGLQLGPLPARTPDLHVASARGELILRFTRLDGPRAVRLPLVRVAPGAFAAGPATLRARRVEDGWAVTTAERVAVP
jgi:hypothetical protein